MSVTTTSTDQHSLQLQQRNQELSLMLADADRLNKQQTEQVESSKQELAALQQRSLAQSAEVMALKQIMNKQSRRRSSSQPPAVVHYADDEDSIHNYGEDYDGEEEEEEEQEFDPHQCGVCFEEGANFGIQCQSCGIQESLRPSVPKSTPAPRPDSTKDDNSADH